MKRIYHHEHPFVLESGRTLAALTIVYHTYGTLNGTKDNTVWVCHALTADSDVARWWPRTVEAERFLDPAKHFVVCANILGSHYGTTGPLHTDPATGEPYFGDFPPFTIRDMVRVHMLLAEALGIRTLAALIGSSVGGFQAVEWAVMRPGFVRRLVLIATAPKASPWTIAIDETQRMAIRADASFGERRPDAGRSGLAAARAIGMLTYRGPLGYNLTQQDVSPESSAGGIPSRLRAASYQQHQGQKLCRRYDAYSYVAVLDAFDTHDVGRGRGGVAAALSRITAKTLLVGIASDLLFPPEDMRRTQAMIRGSLYREIDSPFGHDGFLVEHERLNALLTPFIGRSGESRCGSDALRSAAAGGEGS